MATQKPRFMVTISQEMKERIDEYHYEYRCKNQTQAINELIERGLDVLTRRDAKKEEPVLVDELTDDEREFIETFGALNPQNQRLLLGIGALILQAQENSPD